jgi:acetyltransferase-like isoleucine patch superfamily enzyme
MTPQVIPPNTREALAGLPFSIGEFTYGVPRIRWWGEPATLKIGKFCSLADNIEIFLGGNHRIDWVTTYPFPAIADWPEAAEITGHPSTNGDVIIGNDVWICSAAIIASGVTIGDGAVIGSRAVVTKDVPPYGIAMGNPAQTVRKRFDDKTIERLLAARWWDWDVERIRASIPLLASSQIEDFLAAAEAELGVER